MSTCGSSLTRLTTWMKASCFSLGMRAWGFERQRCRSWEGVRIYLTIAQGRVAREGRGARPSCGPR